MKNVTIKSQYQFPSVTLSFGSKMVYAKVQERNRKIYSEAIKKLGSEVVKRSVKQSSIVRNGKTNFTQVLTSNANDLIMGRIIRRNLSNPSPWHKDSKLPYKLKKVASAKLASQNKVGVITSRLRQSTWMKVKQLQQ